MPGFAERFKRPPEDEVRMMNDYIQKMLTEAEDQGATAVEIDGQVFTLSQIRDIQERIMAGKNDEFYQYECWGWNVTMAHEIVADGRGPNERFPLLHELVGIGQVDESRIEEADYNVPLIAVPFWKGGWRGLLVIDGWHRINKAYRRGIKDLPCHALSEEEEKRIRMPGCPWEVIDEQKQHAAS